MCLKSTTKFRKEMGKREGGEGGREGGREGRREGGRERESETYLHVVPLLCDIDHSNH